MSIIKTLIRIEVNKPSDSQAWEVRIFINNSLWTQKYGMASKELAIQVGYTEVQEKIVKDLQHEFDVTIEVRSLETYLLESELLK